MADLNKDIKTVLVYKITRVFFGALFFLFSTPTPAETPQEMPVRKKQVKSARVCNLGYEIFSEKLSDTCKSSILGKVKNDQDRIFVERILGDWEPLSGYDVQLGDGFVQLANDRDEDFLQIQWISYKPAIAYINGVIVVDDQDDVSTYRRFSRMLKKAGESEALATMRSRLSPIELFLFSDEALAKRKKKKDGSDGENTAAEDAAYLFTLNGLTTKASDQIERNFDNDSVRYWTMFGNWNGALHDDGYVTKPAASTFSKTRLQCVEGTKGHKQLGEVKEFIGDVPITITPVKGSRTEFYVRGYPMAETTLRVNMAKQSDLKGTVEKKRVGAKSVRRWSKKLHRRVWRKVPTYRVIRHLACENNFSEENNPSCLSAYQDMAKFEDEDGTYAGIGPYIQKRLDELAQDHNSLDNPIHIGSQLKCESEGLFPNETRDAQVAACRKFLRKRFRDGKTIFAADGSSEIFQCEAASGKKSNGDGLACNKKVDSLEGPAFEKSKPTKEQLTDAQVEKMQAYAKMYHSLYPDSDEASVCPEVSRGFWTRRSNYENKKSISKISNGVLDDAPTVNDLGTCLSPPTGAKPELANAFRALGAGAKKNYKDLLKESFHNQLEKRVLGVMMLNECCDNQKCADLASSKLNIKLEGVKGGTSE